ncbi:hypothetical protein D3C76_1505950 [compost metagenome]
MAHAGLGERLGADEEVALIDGATVHRQGRADQGEVLAKRRQQGVGDRPYVARRRAVEGGAVLLVDARAAAGLEPGQCRQGVAHRLIGGAGAAL